MVGLGSTDEDYIRHLFLAGEMLGPILVSLHNLRHFQRFMADLRGAIRAECGAKTHCGTDTAQSRCADACGHVFSLM